MPAKNYTPRRPIGPRPNLRDLGYSRVAEILHDRLRPRVGNFFCFVLPTGTTYLRATCESRTDMPAQGAWVGTYNNRTPIEMIESDLLDRLRELNSQALAA